MIRSSWSWTGLEDTTGGHRNKSVQWPEGIDGWRLPAYSPELNPVEHWFKELREPLANRIFETVEAIEEALTEALRPYWNDLEKLARLTRYHWWVEGLADIPTS